MLPAPPLPPPLPHPSFRIEGFPALRLGTYVCIPSPGPSVRQPNRYAKLCTSIYPTYLLGMDAGMGDRHVWICQRYVL